MLHLFLLPFLPPGSWTPVLMYAGTVGTIIANNYITDFQFGGVQCGQGDGNVADCMLNTIQDNIITAESAIYPVPNGDGSGIYYDLHWYNPGALRSCCGGGGASEAAVYLGIYS
ncbi:unnamed protein product [Closterium sp. NIES-54]